jgi:hypothetical protein
MIESLVVIVTAVTVLHLIHYLLLRKMRAFATPKEMEAASAGFFIACFIMSGLLLFFSGVFGC